MNKNTQVIRIKLKRFYDAYQRQVIVLFSNITKSLFVFVFSYR